MNYELDLYPHQWDIISTESKMKKEFVRLIENSLTVVLLLVGFVMFIREAPTWAIGGLMLMVGLLRVRNLTRDL